MVDNPRKYSEIKERILRDFKERFPKVKIRKWHSSWGGTEFGEKGKADRVTIPLSDGPAAIKTLLHEAWHCVAGRVNPISIGEWEADRNAIRLMRQYGVEPNSRLWDRIYDYQVKCVARELKQGKQLPEKVAWMKRDAEIYNELGPSFWRKNVRDIRKIQERMQN